MSTDAADGAADVELVVGRIGKPHGLRGEVTVEVRTDEPERRFARGSTLRAEPPPGSASSLRRLTVADSRWHQSVLLVTFEELADRTAAEAARGILLHVTVPLTPRPRTPTSSTTTSWWGWRRTTKRARRSAPCPESSTAARRTC